MRKKRQKSGEADSVKRNQKSESNGELVVRLMTMKCDVVCVDVTMREW